MSMKVYTLIPQTTGTYNNGSHLIENGAGDGNALQTKTHHYSSL
jgi:hypothetical protein